MRSQQVPAGDLLQGAGKSVSRLLMLGWDPLHVIQIPPTLSYHLEHSCHHPYPHSHYIAGACYKPALSTEGPLTESDGTCALGNLMKILFTAGLVCHSVYVKTTGQFCSLLPSLYGFLVSKVCTPRAFTYWAILLVLLRFFFISYFSFSIFFF